MHFLGFHSLKIVNIKRKLLKFGCSLCFHEAVETSIAHLFGIQKAYPQSALFKLHLVMALKRSTNSSVKKAVQILGSEQTTTSGCLESINDDKDSPK